MIGYKIKKYRELRNLSQDHMAAKLGIQQPAYSKLEQSDSIATKYVKKIAEVLDVPEAELMNDRMVFNLNNPKFANGSIGGSYIETVHNTQKELYEGIITEMKQELSALRKDRDKMMALLEKISK